MNIWDYFTPEQQEKLKIKMEQFSLDEIKVMRKESNELLAQLRKGLENNIPPDHPEIVSSAKRLDELQAIFNDRDPAIEQAIERFHVENPDAQIHGIDLQFYRYITKAKLSI